LIAIIFAISLKQLPSLFACSKSILCKLHFLIHNELVAISFYVDRTKSQAP
jgi:hypothetical protein